MVETIQHLDFIVFLATCVKIAVFATINHVEFAVIITSVVLALVVVIFVAVVKLIALA